MAKTIKSKSMDRNGGAFSMSMPRGPLSCNPPHHLSCLLDYLLGHTPHENRMFTLLIVCYFTPELETEYGWQQTQFGRGILMINHFGVDCL